MNRLRTHFADQQAQKRRRRLQGAIVRDYRDDIIELIADDGAKLSEVASAVLAHGEPVLDHGFKAEILKQIGKVKDIRAGKVKDIRVEKAKAAASHGASVAPQAPSMPIASATAPPAVPANLAGSLAENDEGDFAARRSRG